MHPEFVMGIPDVESCFARLWADPITSELRNFAVQVSCYPGLAAVVPDEFLYVEDVFPGSGAPELWARFAQYVQGDEVFPFLGMVGGKAYVCFGYGGTNRGQMFLLDFDFGLFHLDPDYAEFTRKLARKPWPHGS
ncbi:hypothetical protein H1235_06630 [Pseudoxanthomonas sp. NC8]|nr:hypothetical protein H1235_06630 [Pseudoxanthomonas sp. NC8]